MATSAALARKRNNGEGRVGAKNYPCLVVRTRASAVKGPYPFNPELTYTPLGRPHWMQCST
eukprot:5919753-Amphidinium_carterae.1